MADFSPNTAPLLGDSPWEFLRSIGVARARINFGFSVPEILSVAAVLPIALNASTLRAADLAPFAHLDVELIQNFYPREWTGLALSSVASSVADARQFGWRGGAAEKSRSCSGACPRIVDSPSLGEFLRF